MNINPKILAQIAALPDGEIKESLRKSYLTCCEKMDDYHKLEQIRVRDDFKRRDYDAKLTRAGLYGRNRNISFTSLIDDEKLGDYPKGYIEGHRLLCHFVSDYRASFKGECRPDEREYENIVLAGPTGVGKTYMAASLANHCVLNNLPVFFVSVPYYTRTIVHMYRVSNDEASKIERKIMNCPFVVLDDLGAEDTKKDWVTSLVEAIFIERYNRGYLTLCTTNLTFTAFKSTYGDRVFDRVFERGKMHTIDGRSFRTGI